MQHSVKLWEQFKQGCYHAVSTDQKFARDAILLLFQRQRDPTETFQYRSPFYLAKYAKSPSPDHFTNDTNTVPHISAVQLMNLFGYTQECIALENLSTLVFAALQNPFKDLDTMTTIIRNLKSAAIHEWNRAVYLRAYHLNQVATKLYCPPDVNEFSLHAFGCTQNRMLNSAFDFRCSLLSLFYEYVTVSTYRTSSQKDERLMKRLRIHTPGAVQE